LTSTVAWRWYFVQLERRGLRRPVAVVDRLDVVGVGGVLHDHLRVDLDAVQHA
jgi:hypothetical protein